MSAGVLALISIGLALLLGVAVAVLVLLNRVLRPLREIKRYADDILAAGLGIASNLDGADEAVHTRELVVELPAFVRDRFGTEGVEWSA